MSRRKKEHQDLMSVTDAAIALKMKYHRVRDLVLSGQLGEVHRSGSNRYFIKPEAVEQYRKEHQDDA